MKRLLPAVLLNALITIIGVLTVAIVGLVVEDALPNPTQQHVDARRVILAVLGLATLIGLVVWRTVVARAFGTLYYVTYLAAGMPETHLSELREHVKRHRGARRLSKKFLAPAPSANLRVSDVASDVTDLARSLWDSMNADDSDTGFNLAPDLLFPMGLSFGYQLPAWKGTTLDELHWRDLAHRHVDRWTLVSDAAGSISHQSRRGIIETRSAGPARGAARVIADLTERDAADPPWCFETPSTYRVAAFEDSREDALARRRPVLLAECEERARDGFAVVPAREMVSELLNTVRRAIHQSEGEPVFLALRVPKTVSVALGFALAQEPCTIAPGCRQSVCANPWEVLVPLYFDQVASGQPYVPMRVHEHQPSSADLQRRVQALMKP